MWQQRVLGLEAILLLRLLLGPGLNLCPSRSLRRRDLLPCGTAHPSSRWLGDSGRLRSRLPTLDIAFATRPANTVAGDYYDVFPRSRDDAEGRVLIIIADVAGKSIPAALLMATFQASLRTLSESRCSLSELTAGLNRYLAAHSRGGLRFTTAFLGEYDPGSGCLNYINAGHNAPVLLRAAGSNVERLELGGVPLGIPSDAQYECGTVTVCPGDLVVLFTDGVIEAANNRQEEYGEARLLSLLETSSTGTADEVLRRLMQHVESFIGDAPQHGDMTCVVLRCR